MQILLQTGSVSQQAYDQTKTQFDVADANVDNLEKNTYIRAPFNGIISGKYFESGEMYSGSPTTNGKAAIITLVQINPLKAMVNVSEAYYPNLKQGKTVTVSSEIFAEKKISGNITRIYPTIDPSSHTFQIEIAVPNAGEQLKPGMYCSVSIDLGKVDALMIPSQSILKMQGSNERYIFINDNGKAKKVKVLLGQRIDDQVEIISNEIKAGDELVVEGQGRLESGNKLIIVK
jgi:RND family efflux transporter MFP subunit